MTIYLFFRLFAARNVGELIAIDADKMEAASSLAIRGKTARGDLAVITLDKREIL